MSSYLVGNVISGKITERDRRTKKSIMQLSYVKAKFCYASHGILFYKKKASFNLHDDSNIYNRSDDEDIQARIE